MELQPYQGSQQAVALYQGEQLLPEEIERRQKEAEELDVKLRHIVEDVPDRQYHTMGSNAGAGSGEFHTYRHSRRREQERLKRIDEDAERAEKDKEREEKINTLQEVDEARTSKRRAKRQKKKEKQRTKKPRVEGSGAGPSGDEAGDRAAADGSDGSGSDAEEALLKEQPALD